MDSNEQALKPTSLRPPTGLKQPPTQGIKKIKVSPAVLNQLQSGSHSQERSNKMKLQVPSGPSGPPATSGSFLGNFSQAHNAPLSAKGNGPTQQISSESEKPFSTEQQTKGGKLLVRVKSPNPDNMKLIDLLHQSGDTRQQAHKTLGAETHTSGFNHTHRHLFRSGDRADPQDPSKRNSDADSGLPKTQNLFNQQQFLKQLSSSKLPTASEMMAEANQTSTYSSPRKLPQTISLRQQKLVVPLKSILVQDIEQITNPGEPGALHNKGFAGSKNTKLLKSRSPQNPSSLFPEIKPVSHPDQSQGASAQKPKLSNSLNRQSVAATQHQSLFPTATTFAKHGAQIVGDLSPKAQRSKGAGRADSCQHTINNTTSSIVNLAMQSPEEFMVKEVDMKSLVQQVVHTQPVSRVQGRVLGTNNSRKGILMKTGMTAVYSTNEYDGSQFHKHRTVKSSADESGCHTNIGSPKASGTGHASLLNFEVTAPSGHTGVSPAAPSRRVHLSHLWDEFGSAGSVFSGGDDDYALSTGKQEFRNQQAYLDQLLLKNYRQEDNLTRTNTTSNFDKLGATLAQKILLSKKARAESDDREKKDGPKSANRRATVETVDNELEGIQLRPQQSKSMQKLVPKVMESGKALGTVQSAPGTKKSEPPPFDFNFIKILIKKGSIDKEAEFQEIMIERDWVQKNNNVPHFANVIKNVSSKEGVEITMNCNADAFRWIMAFVRIKTDTDEQLEDIDRLVGRMKETETVRAKEEMEGKLYDKLDEVTPKNCLNIMVTAFFLQLGWVYERVWKFYFARNFSEIINSCKIPLSNINPNIITDIADRISELELQSLKERKDKFISNVYKARIDLKVIQQIASLSIPKAERTKENFVNLYWCPRCEELLTQSQALKIPCKARSPVDDNILEREGKRMPEARKRTFFMEKLASYYRRKNQPSSLIQAIFMDAAEDEGEGIIESDGRQFTDHDLIFADELPYLREAQTRSIVKKAKPKQKDSQSQLEQTQPILKASEPINIENFVKFFREKYRLCWKEIYLKFLALLPLPERCRNCCSWFSFSHMGECSANIDPLEDAPSNMGKVSFHEVDLEEEGLPNINGLAPAEVEIFKQEYQVIDNIFAYSLINLKDPSAVDLRLTKMESNQSQTKRNGVNHVDLLVENYKDKVEFVDPQSMNFDIKVNSAFKEFLRTSKDVYVAQQGAVSQRSQPSVLAAAEEDLEDVRRLRMDDAYYSTPRAQPIVSAKLRSEVLMKRLHREAENLVRDNPDDYPPPSQSAKFDYSINQAIDLQKGKRKGPLEPYQAAHAQALVIKKFARIKKDIMNDDDHEAMIKLSNILAGLRIEEDLICDEPSFSKQSSQRTNQRSNSRGQSKGARHRSPIMQRADNLKMQNQNMVELGAQAGIKIYSDIKQITGTKKKSPNQANQNTSGVRKNIFQRNPNRQFGTGKSQGAKGSQDRSSFDATPNISSKKAEPVITRTVKNSSSKGRKLPIYSSTVYPSKESDLIISHENARAAGGSDLDHGNARLKQEEAKRPNVLRSPGPPGGMPPKYAAAAAAATGSQPNLMQLQIPSMMNQKPVAAPQVNLSDQSALPHPSQARSGSGNPIRGGRSPVLVIRPSKIEKSATLQKIALMHQHQ